MGDLLKHIEKLEQEISELKNQAVTSAEVSAVTVPEAMKPLFDTAQQTVADYFRHLTMDPSHGTIEINDQRYVLVRASALSKDFLDTILKLYADRGEEEAMSIGKNFLFDIAHVIGMNDAKNFHARMGLTDPVAKLSAGPVHFAYSGWAYVDILPESHPSPDENFYLIYHHPYSFEADSWKRSGKKSATAVCIMNAGYSSGWCEESFGIPLTAVEVSCTARGDSHCTFIMSPPERIQEHADAYYNNNRNIIEQRKNYEIPTFFDRKRVEEEMQRSKQLAEASAKSKSDFVANMSHELRTPLGVVLGFTDLLQKTKLDAVQKEYLDAVHTAGSSLLAIINDILDLSRLDAEKFIIEKIPFSVPELIHSVQVMFASKAKQKNLKFTCMADTSVNYAVIGDPMRLTQMLINLISNAIKFTDTGSVTVSCTAENESDEEVKLKFSIKDTGIGIPAGKADKIFERFTQGDTDITRKYGGTGLGLHITKQLAELQQGSLSLISNDGKGAEFIFVLPYTKAPDIKDFFKSTAGNTPPAIEPGKTVLLVEDNVMNRKLAAVLLQSHGFNITLAEDGSRAIEILKSETFDIILMDIQMPILDGYNATNHIRSQMHITAPIIAMTAHVLPGEKEKCLQCGMNAYISKPFDEKELMKAIAQCLYKKEAAMQNNEGVINLDYLKLQTKNNMSFIFEMMDIFIKQNPADTQTLYKAAAAQDFALLYKTAHSLRNTTSLFGLGDLLNEKLMRIEAQASAGEISAGVKKDIEYINEICGKAVKELGAIDKNNLQTAG